MVAKDAGRKSARSLSPGMAKGYEKSASEATRSDHHIFQAMPEGRGQNQMRPKSPGLYPKLPYEVDIFTCLSFTLIDPRFRRLKSNSKNYTFAMVVGLRIYYAQ